ncbi:FAD/NAD(P)-binding oxidoreductase [Frankia sp. Cas4]|uniref:NAD(P)/FAD-dependent oxidoreductase n=1 Tax=Frankia sp. Cas4 TaxID=3073927 RepID=UPI002AD3EB72|nr:FAD/NAD(P)-binding oxidoreductase [Frankia sp. Cas4]
MATTSHHTTLIIGGGSAGISVAARLRRAGSVDVGLIDPAETHYYQPLWTLVGGGCAPLASSARPQAGVMPAGVAWIRDRAETIDTDNQIVTTGGGARIGYDHLVVCPGIQLDWTTIPGMGEAVTTPWVSSNYTYDLAPKTWEMIRSLRSGTAVFTMPAGPIKCGGAPQKIAYLACDFWRRHGVLDDIRVVLVLPTPALFGVPEFADVLATVVARYGIEVRLNSELTEVDPESRRAVVIDHATGVTDDIGYDLMHLVPPQSAPDWIKKSPLADPTSPAGYVSVDKHTMQHTRYSNVFSLGDASSSPNAKTGAAIRKQAPVVVANLLSVMNGQPAARQYDGYASCPLTTARNKMLLAEFDYTMRPHPTFPPWLVNAQRERRDMWYLKRYGLPLMYWNLLLKGRA